MKLIDLSSIKWTIEKRDCIVRDMHTNHICRALAWIVSRQIMSEKILKRVPGVFHENLTHHNGRSLEEWVDIFSAVLHDRAEAVKSERLDELKAELERLEPPDDKIARLKEEIQKLIFSWCVPPGTD